MASCAIIPRVKNKKGEVVDSKLFKDLLSFTSYNRPVTTEIYLKTKNPRFSAQVKGELKYDENNEPTLRSLFNNTNIATYISEKNVYQKLNKDIGHFEKDNKKIKTIEDTTENFNKLVEKAIEFNNKNDFKDDYVAIVSRNSDKNSNSVLSIEVVKRTQENSAEADSMEKSYNLNKQIRGLLKEFGVKDEALTDLEERVGINGITDFSKLEEMTKGLVALIRIAKGMRGEKVLPEEFAHFSIEALGDHPLVNRLLNLLSKEDVIQKILGNEYDDYILKYKGDKILLAKEAAGKLVAKHMLDNNPIPASPHKTLLQRVIEAIKNLFKKMDPETINNAITEADKTAGEIAKKLLNGDLNNNISLNNIKERRSLYNLQERIDRDKKLVRAIIENEVRRLQIYKKVDTKGTFSINQQILIDKIEQSLKSNNEIEGIYTFLTEAIKIVGQLSNRLNKLMQQSNTINIIENSQQLRYIRNYIYSYKSILKMISEVISSEQHFNDNRYDDRITNAVKDVMYHIGIIEEDYKQIALPLVVPFLQSFLGNDIVIPFGKFKGRKISIEELMRESEDIGFFDRWLDSMADSSSYVLKSIDQAVKLSKGKARLRTIEFKKRLEALGIELEKAGIRDTEWMFEKDEKGNKTGRYISDRNYGKYRKAKQEKFSELEEKYGKNPAGEDLNKRNAELSKWYNEHTEKVNGVTKPKESLYPGPNLNNAQKKFYDGVMAIKKELDAMLPEGYVSPLNTVKIRKELLERMKSPNNAGKQFWEAVKDTFIRRCDDTDIGDRVPLQDFEGHVVQMLPIYFTKIKAGESENDISTDVVGTLIAYASMAIDFNEMSKIINLLETARSVLRDKLNVTDSKYKNKENRILKQKYNIRILQRLDDYFDMQIYGKYMDDEGSWGKIDKAKLTNFINHLTSLNMLGLNALAGISNVTTGIVMMNIEAFCKQFFNKAAVAKADAHYAKYLPMYLGNIGSRVKTDWLSLFDEMFNVLQDYETEIRDTRFNIKNRFKRLCGTSAFFVMNNAGEHWMQNRTALALAMSYKMKDANGRDTNLIDALEIVYTDPSDKSKGARMRIKEGYTKEDGSTFTEKDIIAFERKAAAINQRMHGIYNKLDRSAIQKVAIGRMAIMFRKWIKPSLNRRFKSMSKNLDLDAWTEGYYITTWRFFKQIAKESKEGQFSISTNWNNLTIEEKQNIKRGLTEISHFLILVAFLGMMKWDDDDKSWLKSMIELQARRLYTELGSQVPGPQMASEAFTILKSPAAGIKTLESIGGLVGLLNPYNYEWFNGEDAIIQSGRYKDHTKAYKLFYESPVIPMNKTIYRGLHPDESIPFYK